MSVLTLDPITPQEDGKLLSEIIQGRKLDIVFNEPPHPQYGHFIRSVKGVSSGDNGGFWFITPSGVFAYGVDSYRVHAGETIIFALVAIDLVTIDPNYQD